MLWTFFATLLLGAIGEYTCAEKDDFESLVDSYEFSLIDLPYSYDYLEPVIIADTMHAHHDQHHQKYVNKLNSFLADNTNYQSYSLVDLQYLAKNELTLQKHAGGDYNHRMYWWIMTSPYCAKGAPSGSLLTQIEADFGSFDDFKADFQTTSENLFGSGWVWACVNIEGNIEIRETDDQINPLMEITDDLCYPFFGSDIWEHAYYLQYLWDRPAFVTKFWDIVDWDIVEMFYENYAAVGVAIPLG